MLTKKDFDIIDYLTKFKCASTSTIKEVFGYNTDRAVQRRLKILVEDYKEIKRDRENFTLEFTYYIKKPAQLRHSLLLTDFHRELHKIANIHKFDNEVTIDHLRADGLIVWEVNEKKYLGLIEVQISNNKFNVGKYYKMLEDRLHDKYFGGTFPYIIAVTNQKIPYVEEFNIIQIRTDMSDIDKLLKL